MKCFSPFFLLMGGLALSLQAQAQAGPTVASHAVAVSMLAAGTAAPHSSQLPQEELVPVSVLTALAKSETAAASQANSPAAAVGATEPQLLLGLLETIQTQQTRLDALQVETEAAVRRANRAEAATVAFEQRLRQLEAAGSRPSFWR